MQTREVVQALTEAFRNQAEEARLGVVHFREGAGVLRVSHLHKENAVALLRSLQRVGTRPVIVRTLGTSGTVRQAIRKYLEPQVREDGDSSSRSSRA